MLSPSRGDQRHDRIISSANNLISFESQEVTLHANIQKIGEYKIREVPVKIVRVPSNLEVTVIPSTFSLIVEGGIDYIATMTKEDIDAYIDYRRASSLAVDSTRYRIFIKVPEEVKRWESKPQFFRLIIERKR